MKAPKPGPVMVATDLTEASCEALAWACRYAGRFGAKLFVLHVVHEPADDPGFYRRTDKDRAKPLEAVADKRLRKHLKAAARALGNPKTLKSAKTVLVTGLPATRIVEVAAAKGVELVVMGGGGHGGVGRFLSGSTVHKVVERCSAHVLVYRATPPPAEAAPEPEAAAPDAGEAS